MRIYDARVIVDVALELWRASDAPDDARRPIDFIAEAVALLQAADKLLPEAARFPTFPMGGAELTEEQQLEAVRKFARAFKAGLEGGDDEWRDP